MTNRVNWTCPGCQATYAVPRTTGLTVCPTCKRKLRETDQESLPSRRERTGFRLTSGLVFFSLWMLWNFVVGVFGFLLMSTVESVTTSSFQRKAQSMYTYTTYEQERSYTIQFYLLFLGAVYFTGLMFLAILKYLTSR